MRSHRFVLGAFPFKGRCNFRRRWPKSNQSFQAQIRMVSLFPILYQEIKRETNIGPSCSKYFDKKNGAVNNPIEEQKSQILTSWTSMPASAQNHIVYEVLRLVRLSLSASKRPAQGWTVSIHWARLSLLFARVSYLLQFDSLHTE